MSNFDGPASAEPAAWLSIGQLAQRSGVEVATLRTWEARYGFPTPQRLAGGHRRYRESDIALVAEVARRRSTGLSMAAAISAALGDISPASSSFFAHLRGQHPELQSHLLTKRVLLALTRAVEDECCARAARPVLFASFQRESAYRRVESRWQELSRTAAHTAVFANFEHLRESGPGLVEVPLAPDGAARREWTLICDAADFPACVVGWELPTVRPLPDGQRLFETIWSLDAQAVRQASRVGLGLLADFQPDLAGVMAARLYDSPLGPSPDLRQATTLFARALSYVQPNFAPADGDRRSRHRPG